MMYQLRDTLKNATLVSVTSATNVTSVTSVTKILLFQYNCVTLIINFDITAFGFIKVENSQEINQKRGTVTQSRFEYTKPKMDKWWFKFWFQNPR